MTDRLSSEYIRFFYSAFDVSPEAPFIAKEQYYKLVIAALNKDRVFGCFVRATFSDEKKLNVMSWEELMESYIAFMDGYEHGNAK